MQEEKLPTYSSDEEKPVVIRYFLENWDLVAAFIIAIGFTILTAFNLVDKEIIYIYFAGLLIFMLVFFCKAGKGCTRLF
jgi:hypothetical protein